MRKKYFVNYLVLINAIFFSTAISFAQPPIENPKKVKVETNQDKIFKDWVEKDVKYIIRPEEIDAFKRLKTNEERENFIAIFWDKRDPNPDTEENEFKEEYYERIAYANEKFTSGIPGWKTDRGRIYITFGKPDSIESHPSGGSYDRPSYEGGGSTTTYPFEIWFYRHLDNVGDGLEIEFVDPTGTGEYRMAKNANEKDALLYVPGAGPTLAEQLFGEDRSNRIAGINNASYQREQDSLFRRLEIANSLMTPPKVRDSGLSEITNSSGPITLEGNPIDFDLKVDFFRQSDEKVIAAFTIQADNKELSFKDSGGLQTATMNIFGRVTSVAGKRSGIFEDVVTANSTARELADLKEGKSIYQKAIALAPGATYKVSVAVRDVDSGKIGVRNIGFTVPKYEPNKLGTSTLILASRLYSTTERNIGESFVIGDKKVIPNLSAKYKKGQEVGVYLQVYNVGIDQMTLKPAVEVEYILTKNGKEISRQTEDWKGLSDSGQRLTLARLLPTAELNSGEYELKIKIKDTVNNQLLDPTAKFTIE
ncbi:MAG TPA: GWxTD domain-containing protein [Pyrinomonadaceae bacterium]|nr:GWxTD domain-containing protein [Pyrinomonadaceae bacterium]